MRLRHAAASPLVRKVMICAHELGLAGRIELVPTTVAPFRANAELAPEDRCWTGWTDGEMTKARQGLAAAECEDLAGPRTIGQVTLGCTLGYLDVRFPDDGWRARRSKLAAWYEAVERLPSMQATKPPAGRPECCVAPISRRLL